MLHGVGNATGAAVSNTNGNITSSVSVNTRGGIFNSFIRGTGSNANCRTWFRKSTIMDYIKNNNMDSG